jgi:hypothetical protein
MSDQEELHQQTALWLRDLASKFLERAAGIEEPEFKQKFTRRAFELVQEVVALTPFVDQAEPGSSGASDAAVPASRRRSARPMATRVIMHPQPVRPAVPDVVSVPQTSGAVAFPKRSERHVR